VEAYRARLRRNVSPDPERYRWVTPAELDSLPVSSMTRKILRGLSSPQLPLALEEGARS
jgi:hypothetical protein